VSLKHLVTTESKQLTVSTHVVTKLSPSGGYISKLNSEHDSDTELRPVDLNDLSPQDFVVYKFGCYVCQVCELDR